MVKQNLNVLICSLNENLQVALVSFFKYLPTVFDPKDVVIVSRAKLVNLGFGSFQYLVTFALYMYIGYSSILCYVLYTYNAMAPTLFLIEK